MFDNRNIKKLETKESKRRTTWRVYDFPSKDRQRAVYDK